MMPLDSLKKLLAKCGRITPRRIVEEQSEIGGWL
jgi:hypothetical protein